MSDRDDLRTHLAERARSIDEYIADLPRRAVAAKAFLAGYMDDLERAERARDEVCQVLAVLGPPAVLAPGDITSAEDSLGIRIGALAIVPGETRVSDLRLFAATLREVRDQATHQIRLANDLVTEREAAAVMNTAANPAVSPRPERSGEEDTELERKVASWLTLVGTDVKVVSHGGVFIGQLAGVGMDKVYARTEQGLAWAPTDTVTDIFPAIPDPVGTTPTTGPPPWPQPPTTPGPARSLDEIRRDADSLGVAIDEIGRSVDVFEQAAAALPGEGQPPAVPTAALTALWATLLTRRVTVTYHGGETLTGVLAEVNEDCVTLYRVDGAEDPGCAYRPAVEHIESIVPAWPPADPAGPQDAQPDLATPGPGAYPAADLTQPDIAETPEGSA